MREGETLPTLSSHISVAPDIDGSWNGRAEEYADEQQIRLCQQIESEILARCRPYHNPNTPWPDMWRIAPGIHD